MILVVKLRDRRPLLIRTPKEQNFFKEEKQLRHNTTDYSTLDNSGVSGPKRAKMTHKK
jgi:hypothetical protein